MGAVLLGAVTLACGEGNGSQVDEATKPTKPPARRVGRGPALSSEVNDRFVARLLGKTPKGISLPGVVQDLLQIHSALSRQLIEQAGFFRSQRELSFIWTGAASLGPRSCLDLTKSLRTLGKRRGLTRVATGAPRRRSLDAPAAPRPHATAFRHRGAGWSATAEATCVDAHDAPRPGCPPPCRQPTRLRMQFKLRLPAPAFRTVSEALASFPWLARQLLPEALPAFLVEALDRGNLLKVSCAQWIRQTHCTDLNALLQPSGDRAAWLQDVMKQASAHGFAGAHPRPPGQALFVGYQACSNRSLTGRLQGKHVSLRLTARLGGTAKDTVRRCSAQRAAEPAVP